jgi:4-hydroxy-3-methylbut-2-enyl diphosphate reductase
MKQTIHIDTGAGPCFGVQRAIQMAEDQLLVHDDLACLGDLIHNDDEIRRLESEGMRIISHCQIVEQSGKNILIRAHGEPPSTFRIADTYDVEVIDATCPIVLELQKMVARTSEKMLRQKGQVLLFGDIYHAEIFGLRGHCKSEFHIVRDVDDIALINTAKPTAFFSQTTKYQSDYHQVVEAFTRKKAEEKSEAYPLEVVESVCQYVVKRDLQLIDFLEDKDLLVFVSGQKSSNGNHLFTVGKKHVKHAYFISNINELEEKWFKRGKRIGISGAISTPLWQLNKVRSLIEEIINKK